MRPGAVVTLVLGVFVLVGLAIAGGFILGMTVTSLALHDDLKEKGVNYRPGDTPEVVLELQPGQCLNVSTSETICGYQTG